MVRRTAGAKARRRAEAMVRRTAVEARVMEAGGMAIAMVGEVRGTEGAKARRRGEAMVRRTEAAGRGGGVGGWASSLLC